MSTETKILEEKITNSIKAWDKSLEEKSEKFSFNLNEKCIEELSNNKDKLSNQNPNDFSALNEFVDAVFLLLMVKNYLISTLIRKKILT